MPLFEVEVSYTKTDKYLIEAADYDEAQANFLDGQLKYEDEEAHTITSCNMIKERSK